MESLYSRKNSSKTEIIGRDLRCRCSTSGLVGLVLNAVTETESSRQLKRLHFSNDERITSSLLLSVLVYAYTSGILDSNDIARACRREPGLLYLCRLTPIDSFILRRFRCLARIALEEALSHVFFSALHERGIEVFHLSKDTLTICRNAGEERINRAIQTDLAAVEV